MTRGSVTLTLVLALNAAAGAQGADGLLRESPEPLAALTHWVSEHPTAAEGWNRLGQAAVEARDLDLAVRALERAHALAQGENEHARVLGWVHERRLDLPAAIEAYRRAENRQTTRDGAARLRSRTAMLDDLESSRRRAWTSVGMMILGMIATGAMSLRRPS